MKIDIFYLCDGRATCKEHCSKPQECNHTSDLEHAIHKDCMQGRLFECIRLNDGCIGLFEVGDRSTNTPVASYLIEKRIDMNEEVKSELTI